jgi:hypothetical protein
MIQGLLGSEGFELRASLQGDDLKGQVGGALMRREINLTLTETGVRGTAGGMPVQLDLQQGELVGHIGADSVTLRGVDQISGELGTGLAATSIRALQRGESLEGRIGALNGKSFTLNLDGVPGWIGALLMLGAYCALERAPVKK